MTLIECPREPDVFDAFTTGRWPERCDADLTAHVAACDTCRDLLAVLAPISDSWLATRADVHVPASGMVWWRAQMRARQEAARDAARPIAIAQVIGGLAALIAFIACFIFLGPWLLSSISSSRAFLSPGLATISTISQGWLLGGIVAVVAATSLAVYLAMAED